MVLSNEQLFQFIIEGNADLKPVLWERIKNLMYMLCTRFYTNNMNLCRSRGIEECDIRQIAYIAYNNTFSTYSTDKQYSYTTALGYSLHNEIRSACGRKSDTLNRRPDSLDDLISDEDGYTLAEVVEDKKSTAPFEQIEDNSERENISKAVRAAVDKLPDQERDVISKHYFDNRTFDSISEEIGVSCERVRQIKAKALRYLRHPKISKRLQDDLGYSSYRMYRHTHVDRIAIDRVMIEQVEQRRERYIQELERQKGAV